MNEKFSPRSSHQPHSLFFKIRNMPSGTLGSEKSSFWSQINVQWKKSAYMPKGDHLKESEHGRNVLLIKCGLLFGD